MRHIHEFHPTALIVSVGVVVVLTLTPAAGSAQSCLEFVDTVFDTSSNCEATPEIDRALEVAQLLWDGPPPVQDTPYLVSNMGNELSLWDMTAPLVPWQVDSTTFGVPPQGDQDWGLMNHSVCNNCRYGLASFSLGEVVFELGTGPLPIFGSYAVHQAGDPDVGGFTFSYGDHQYIVSNALDGTGAPANASLYRIDGVGSLVDIGDVVVPGGEPLDPLNGIEMDWGDQKYLYIGDAFRQVHVYRVITIGDGVVALEYVIVSPDFLQANFFRGKGIDFDRAARILVTTDFLDLKIYDVGFSTGSPANPVLLSELSIPGVASAAVQYPLMWVSERSTPQTSRTFDISDPSNPVALDQQFWSPDNAWNEGDCLYPWSARFVENGLILARHSKMQVIDTAACGGGGFIFSDGFESGDTGRWSTTTP